MLRSLYIRNYAIIDELTVEFAGGLNILTGETGAGKSIVIDALGLLLGERATSDEVRRGTDKAVVEGVFAVSTNEPVLKRLKEYGYDESDELIVRREISTRGGSRAFINDSPAPVAMLKEVGDFLIDLHGQHDHQTLLRTDTHIHLLDNAGGLQGLMDDFGAAFDRMQETAAEIRSLKKREAELHRQLEFYEFQLKEIEAVDPKAGEDTELEKELKIRENSENLFEIVSGLHALLYQEADSVRDKLLRARTMLDRLADIDPGFNEHRTECVGAIVVVEEIAKYLQSYTAGIDFEPEVIERMRERLFALGGLRKKFGGSLDAVLEYREKIAHEIELAKNYDSTIEAKTAALREQQKSVGALAAKLSAKRAQVARKVERAVVQVLKELGIEHGKFVVKIEHTETGPDGPGGVYSGDRWLAATRDGIDAVEFHISTNLGEDPKPLARTASGGEISRVMLALKTILAKNDRLPLLVFDEIDTGISGRIASKVGATMRSLADYHQIVAITHLPQIAAMSQHHFVVEKREQNGRTVTRIRRLDNEEHTREVAKLVSGEDVTEASIRTAQELIQIQN